MKNVDMNTANAEMAELQKLSAAYGFDLFVYLAALNELGSGGMVANVDDDPAIRALDKIVHYKLCDGLQALLVTMRAWDRLANEIKRCPCCRGPFAAHTKAA